MRPARWGLSQIKSLLQLRKAGMLPTSLLRGK
jgi:hypothetical protein